MLKRMNGQVKVLVREADKSLLDGYKLDEDVIAHLAACPYSYFEEACDELKATVLQVKQMLVREEQGIEHTFKHLELRSDNAEHLPFFGAEAGRSSFF